MTWPYHSICSLVEVLPNHADFRAAVVENKMEFSKRAQTHLTLPPSHQPFLCTNVDCEIKSRDPRAILYKPRSQVGGSVVCHFGEAHLGRTAQAVILDGLEIPGAEVSARGGRER